MKQCCDYYFKKPDNFDLSKIFDCGQSFRFLGCGDGSFEGVAFGRYLRIAQSGDDIIFYDTDEITFNNVWKKYFSLDTDYSLINNDILSCFGNDGTIRKAMDIGNGIRILRQDPWESLCTFIISQNNNIPRIRKLVSAVSESLGNEIHCSDRVFYSFPSTEAVANAGIEKLRTLSVGFRAPYIYDAAVKSLDGTLDYDSLSEYNTASLINTLMTVKGVGPKVAACTALFGFGRYDAFPVDVWMKKVIAEFYPDGLDISSLGRYSGIAQQYLFYYRRYTVK